MIPARGILVLAFLTALTAAGAGCGGGPGPESGGGSASSGTRDHAPRPGSTPVALEFVRAWENVAEHPYFPIEGLAGCGFTADGTLIICDEKRGKVYGLDSGTLRWYEFDAPGARPYRPLDVAVDGFKVLVLDMGTNSVHRFDLNGSYHDRILDIAQLDPGVRPQVSAFAMDRDGRLVITDVSEQQVMVLDAFMDLRMSVGGPGTASDQLRDPSGVAFLADGSFVVADRGNRRLSHYGRLGFFERVIGGDFEVDNPFVAPQGLAIDRFGNLFVADQGSGRVHVLDRRQRLLFSTGPEFGLQAMPKVPVDVAVGPDGTLAVTDRGRAAVLIYRVIYE